MGKFTEKLQQYRVFEVDDVGPAVGRSKSKINLEQMQLGERVLGQMDIMSRDYVIRTLEEGTNEEIFRLIGHIVGGELFVGAIAAYLDNKALGEQRESHCIANFQRARNGAPTDGE